jgi:hypothetical protein
MCYIVSDPKAICDPSIHRPFLMRYWNNMSGLLSLCKKIVRSYPAELVICGCIFALAHRDMCMLRSSCWLQPELEETYRGIGSDYAPW